MMTDIDRQGAAAMIGERERRSTGDDNTKSFYDGPIRTTWRLFGPRAKVLSLGIGLRLVQAIFVGLPAIVTVWVVDRVRVDAFTSTQAWIAVAIVIGAFVGQYVLLYASNYFAWVSTFEAVGEARIRALQHLQSLPLGMVSRRSTGDITTALTSDIEMVSNFAHHSMPVLFGGVALPIVVFVALLFVDAPLAFAVAISVVVAVPLFIWTNRAFKGLALERGDSLAAANSRIIEYVQGIAVARAFNATGARHELYAEAVADVRKVNDRMAVRLVPIALASIGVVQLGVPIVIAASTYWWFGGRIDAGTALIFMVLLLRVYVPLLQVGMQVEGLRLADSSLERIGRLMDLRPQQSPVVADRSPADATVRLSNVTFGYDDDRPVLAGIDFEARPGSTTAIIGPSGAGKSTVLSLIARFWEPQQGTVSIGGVALPDLTAQQLFDSVTAVFQDVYLFQGTIRENICCGRPVEDSQIERAARAAQAHDFVLALNDGYDTRIGEGGMTLSGGERQRVSIARALLKNSPVILLDEATASMDPLNERAVQAGLAALVANRTLIVVAHRLSTIRSADQILVFDTDQGGPGRIVQRGTHDELIEQEGLYRHLWAERERATKWRVGKRRS